MGPGGRNRRCVKRRMGGWPPGLCSPGGSRVETAPPINFGGLRAPTSDWVVMRQMATASPDNAAAVVTDPLALAALATPLSKRVYESGGILVELASAYRDLFLWPLFDTAGAVLTCRLWGFATAPAGPVALGTVSPVSQLGPAFNLSLEQDSGLPDLTIQAIAAGGETRKLSIKDNCRPYQDATSGTTYYPMTGKPLRFSHLGFPFLALTFSALTAGNALALLRYN